MRMTQGEFVISVSGILLLALSYQPGFIMSDLMVAISFVGFGWGIGLLAWVAIRSVLEELGLVEGGSTDTRACDVTYYEDCRCGGRHGCEGHLSPIDEKGRR